MPTELTSPLTDTTMLVHPRDAAKSVVFDNPSA
jgi:hypothetical protein